MLPDETTPELMNIQFMLATGHTVEMNEVTRVEFTLDPTDPAGHYTVYGENDQVNGHFTGKVVIGWYNRGEPKPDIAIARAVPGKRR